MEEYTWLQIVPKEEDPLLNRNHINNGHETDDKYTIN